MHSFIEEITNNFSELFVESFIIRYLNNFELKDLQDLEDSIEITKIQLTKKINKKFSQKLKNLKK